MKLSDLKTVTGDAAARALASITSPTPTRYRLRGGGPGSEIYVYCALDTLEYALIAHGNYQVSSDPPDGPTIQFALTSAGPEPVAIWMSAVMPEHLPDLPEVEDMPSRCCPFIHFFASPEVYGIWRDTLPDRIRPHIECLPLAEAWARADHALATCETSGSCKCR